MSKVQPYGVLSSPPLGGCWLIVAAARSEANAIALALGGAAPDTFWSVHRLTPRFDLVVSGVGKANAAGATALALDPDRHGGVISLGIAGALLDDTHSPCAPMLSTVVARESVFADEGVISESGWSTIAERGFSPTADLHHDPGMGIRGDTALLDHAQAPGWMYGTIATVSTCSGTDAAAMAVRARTNAVVEAMEGAAVGLASRRAWLAKGGRGTGAFLEVRVVSNTTGSKSEWRIKEALDRLGAVAKVL